LKRVVQRELADRLAVRLLDGTYADDGTIHVSVDSASNELAFS
jgi:ATP-dependent Clp protease ATP-binding subunit ClpA